MAADRNGAARRVQILWLNCRQRMRCPPRSILQAAQSICLQNVSCYALSFGSETFGGEDGAAELERFAHRTPHGPELDRGSLRGGRSYAAAARRPGAAAPNDVLGAEYIRALHRHASEIRPITVTRKGSAHDQPGSAGQIRSLIGSASSAAEQASWKALMPETAANLLEKEMETGKSPVLSEHFDQSVLAAASVLRRRRTAELPVCGRRAGIQDLFGGVFRYVV